MRSTTVVLTALVALSEAASVQKCAASCVIKGIQATGCSSVDSHCICSSDNFLSTVNDCVPEACIEEDKESAIAYAADFCHKIDLAKREALPEPEPEAEAEPEAEPEAAPQSYGGWGGWGGGHPGGWGNGGWWGNWWNWWKKHPSEWKKPQHGHKKVKWVRKHKHNHGGGHNWPKPPPHHGPHPPSYPTHKPPPTHAHPYPHPTNTVWPPPPPYHGGGGHHPGHGGGKPPGYGGGHPAPHHQPEHHWPGWGGGWGGGHW